MTRALTIVGLGEALFDVFPDGERLGGAPLNVAVHAHQIAQGVGGSGVVASRVGHDALGERVFEELAARGMTADYVQRDAERPTGTVLVELRGGEPSYEIVRDVAWDGLELTAGLERLAGECAAVCFGTLGQRSAAARGAIQEFVGRARGAVRLFDVNLRQAFYTPEVLRRSCELASAVKLNEHELPVVAGALGVDAGGGPERVAEALRGAFDLEAVVLTRGAAGTVLFGRSGGTEGEPARYERHERADSVGAGDACGAGVLLGMVLGWPAARTVSLANHLGAYVASRPGATPRLPDEVLAMVR